MSTVDQILEILDKFGSLLYVIVPFGFGIYLNLRDKMRSKEAEVKKANKTKAKQAYNVWEHEESQNVIRKIKNLCNLYKDKSNAGLVQYLQLENGTMATSKICNMFVSCLAEDNRNGRIQKLISKIQRIPYSKVTGWINKIIEAKNSTVDYVLTPDTTAADYTLAEIVDAPDVKSCIVAPVYSSNEILLGMCIFYYPEVNFCGHQDSEVTLINKFRSSVEGILFDYHESRLGKKKEYGLEAEIDD